jgi:hypothetical protein
MPRRSQQKKKGGAVALAPSDFSGGGGCPVAADQAASMSGGAGAADWAISVFGNTDSQQAVAGSNVIEMKNPEAVAVPSADAGVKGGDNKKGGRGVLTDVAVPALLLYANNTFKRRKSMKRTKKSRKSRKSRRGKR